MSGGFNPQVRLPDTTSPVPGRTPRGSRVETPLRELSPYSTESEGSRCRMSGRAELHVPVMLAEVVALLAPALEAPPTDSGS